MRWFIHNLNTKPDSSAYFGDLCSTKMTWKQANAKLITLFPDEEERGRIRGILLSKPLNERLEYFEGGDKEIVAALGTLLLIQGNDFVTQALGTHSYDKS